MKKIKDIWSNFKLNALSGMSLPSRLALWIGVGLVTWGHIQREVGMMVIGTLFIVGGAVVWWIYKGNDLVRKRKAHKKTPIKQKVSAAKSLEMLQAAPAKKQDPSANKVIEEGRDALNVLKSIRQKMGWDASNKPNNKQ